MDAGGIDDANPGPRDIGGAVLGPAGFAGGGGTAPGPPMRWRRDFRSIFGFFSSAIVRVRNLRALLLPCQREVKERPGFPPSGPGAW
jgi:hypothetical protein